MDKKIRIRFHLALGENYMKWQITVPEGLVGYTAGVSYVEPDTKELTMIGCKLHNSKNGAKKIYEGHSKFVVAWIECNHLIVGNYGDTYVPRQNQLKYNPKDAPYWTDEDINCDGREYNILKSDGRKIFR